MRLLFQFRKFFAFFAAIACCFIISSCQKKIQRVVAITQIIDHPAIDQERYGIIDALKEGGFKDGDNIRIVFENAQGNLGTAAQIAHQFVSLKPDVTVAITTPSAQALYNPTKNHHIPLVFTAVTDPIAAKLIKSINDKDPHITGVSDNVPVEPITNLIRYLLPKIKKIGVIYNLGEINSVIWIKALEAHAKIQGIEIEKVSVSKTTEVQQAVEFIVSRNAQALLIPRDNMVVSALSAVCKTAFAHKVPIFTADTSLVDQTTAEGVVAAASFDHYSVGYKAGQLVVKILKGEKPSNLPVITQHDVLYRINPYAVKEYNIIIPETLREVITPNNPTPS